MIMKIYHFTFKIWTENLINICLDAINLKCMIVDRTSNGFETLDDLRRDRVTLHGHVSVGRNARAITHRAAVVAVYYRRAIANTRR